MITDEQFDAAWKAYKGHDLRAALEAIESELLAQGMEKAAEMMHGFFDDEILEEADSCYRAIRASAAQTREGKG